MSDYIKREDAVKVAAQVLTEVAPVLFPGTIAEEIIEKRMNDLQEAEIRSGDRISRCELFNRLATITAEDPNEMKAKIYAVIQEMETEPERVIAEIKVDTEELMERIREEYELEDNIVRCNDDYSCPNCYYEMFDDTAFPCSRCIRNMPKDNMFQPKVAEQTERSE